MAKINMILLMPLNSTIILNLTDALTCSFAIGIPRDVIFALRVYILG